MTRTAACRCGQLRIACSGEPVRISICHCLACQQRTGSVFGTQARFPRVQIQSIEGRATEYVRTADSGNKIIYRFCPNCGSTVYYTLATAPDLIAIPIGAFADPSFPPPRVQVYVSRAHPWAPVPDGIKTEGDG